MDPNEKTARPFALKTVFPEDDPDWDERLIRSDGNYSFFHSSAWAHVLRGSYGYKPCYFVSAEESAFSVLVPMMEVDSILTRKRGVSLPFSDYCDPLVAGGRNREEIFEAVAAHGRKRGWKYIEFRGDNGFEDRNAFAFFYSHRLDLSSGSDRLFSSLAGAARRAVKKAVKEGVRTELSRSLSALGEFHRLNRMTRKEHGLPPQPFHFFVQIHRHVIEWGKGFTMLSYIGDEPIAGAVFFHIGDRVVFKYGASDRNRLHLRANNLLMWEAIKWAADAGFRSFCFGRTEPGNDGLRRFKSGWGAKEGVIMYYRYDLEKNEFHRMPVMEMDLHRRIFKRMPIPLLNLIGQLFYRHMG